MLKKPGYTPAVLTTWPDAYFTYRGNTSWWRISRTEPAVFVSEVLGNDGVTSFGRRSSTLEWLVNRNRKLYECLNFSFLPSQFSIFFTYLFSFFIFSAQVTWTPSSVSGYHVTTLTGWWKTIKRRTKPRKDDERLSRDSVIPKELNILFCDEKELK